MRCCAIGADPTRSTHGVKAPSNMPVNDYRSVKTTQRTLPTSEAGRRKGHMSEVHRVAVEIGGTEIAFETGKMAKQASGAVTVTAGDTDGALHRDGRQPARR